MGKLVFSLSIIGDALITGQILYGAVKGELARTRTDVAMTTVRNVMFSR